MSDAKADFGFREVLAADKRGLVGRVFTSVAGRYDLMNDLMSFGSHRLWKRFAVNMLAPRRGQRILDLAGGTGDLSALIAGRVGRDGLVVCADINSAMLAVGRDRLIDRGRVAGIGYAQANAERLPWPDAAFDGLTIAFGLRNVTDKAAALREMQRVLKPGGAAIVLEFSKVVVPWLAKVYDGYSFAVLPWLGRLVADDRDSYQYLVESIHRHPDQKTLAGMMSAAGFERVDWHNLSGGIVAVHRGYKL
jgi:demethylmenaquinone methyltransferase/2-methoxy-6-polyprenyl-1,4-benzoquinol methylase